MKRHKAIKNPAMRGLKHGDCSKIKEACKDIKADFSAFRSQPSKKKPPMLFDDDGNMIGRAEPGSHEMTQESDYKQMITALRVKTPTQRAQGL